MKIRNSKGEVVTVPDEYKQKVKDNIDNPEYISALAEQFKSGGMIKRKDGSYSRRGLWDNIRANRGSGRKPTKEMLKQEAKIRAKAGDGLVTGYSVPQGYFLNSSAYKKGPSDFHVYQPSYVPGQNASPGTAEQDYTIESLLMPMPKIAGVFKGTKIAETINPTLNKAEKLLKAAQKEENLNTKSLDFLKNQYNEGIDRVKVYKNARNKFQDDLLEAKFTGKNIKDYGWNDQDIELLSGKDRSIGAFSNNFYLDDNAANQILADQAFHNYEPMHYKGVTPHDPTGHSIFDFPQAPKESYTIPHTGYIAKKPSRLKKILTFGLPDDSDRLYNLASKYDRERSAAAKLYNLEKAKEFPNLYNQPYKVTEFPILNKKGGTVTNWTPGDAIPWHTSTIGETMGKGGYTVKRSSARKGKTHVVIGPDGTKKYFGDSHLGQHPGNPKRKKAFYARHKHNLAKNPYFRAFARATWADGGKLGQNMYDLGVMPYADGGYTFGNMNPDGTIHVPIGYGTHAYNERYDFGGWVSDAGKLALNTLASPVEQISGNNFVNFRYDNKAMADAAAVSEGIIGGATDVVGSMYLGPAYEMGKKAIQPTTSKLGHSKEAQRGADKWANKTGQIASSTGDLISGIMSGNPQQIVGGAGQFLGTTGQQLGSKELATTGQLTSAASQFMGPSGMPQGAQMGSPMANMVAKRGGYIMAVGGPIDPEQLEALQGVQDQEGNQEQMAEQSMQQGMVPINVEGANFSSGSGPLAKKGELLVNQGRIVKNYVGRPPHPEEGQNPMGNDNAPEGLIVIPKYRTKEYLEAGLEKRKQIERSLVSQQQDREMKKMKRPSKKMGDGGYYSFGGDEAGMGYGGLAYSDQLGGHDYAAQGGPIGNPETIDSMMGYGYKKGGWIQKATASIKRRGTEGVCTGSKFGSSSCPPGSRRYNLAKTFRKMARSRHEDGGMTMYAEGGQLPEEINSYVAKRYEMGGPVNVDKSYVYEGMRRRAMAADGLITGLTPAAGLGDMYTSNQYGWSPYSAGPVTPAALEANVPMTYDLDSYQMPGNGSFLPNQFTVTKSASPYNTQPISGLTPANSGIPGSYNWNMSGNLPTTTVEGNPTSMNFNRFNTTPTYIMDPAQLPGGGTRLPKQGTPSYGNFNWANIGQDVAGAAPILYNLGRGLFEKPFKINAADYMTPDMKFRSTKFDTTPYDYATSRALYNNQTGLAGRTALASAMAQNRAAGYNDWQTKEALRRQGVDQANLENIRANNAIKMQTAIMNRQAIDRKSDFLAESANQLAQTFGRDPRYFAALAGDKSAYRQPFTGWKSNG